MSSMGGRETSYPLGERIEVLFPDVTGSWCSVAFLVSMDHGLLPLRQKSL
jgi:hypothetical protein